MAKFTVDTHLFRELGELLVGRDSTALVELIKNAYDADATNIAVEGEHLDSTNKGRILIWDNGTGMTPRIFEDGFLRIASRRKEAGNRKSAVYARRYTGHKGIGRLAAHKLARHMTVSSVPDRKVHGQNARSVDAIVDWTAIEKFETLDEIDATALSVKTRATKPKTDSGTLIELTNLRRKWTAAERQRFFREIQSFRPPEVLIDLPTKYFKNDFLIKTVKASDTTHKDPGLDIELLGDFETGDEYWQALVESASWLIEIDATKGKSVEYQISPTTRTLKEFPDAEANQYSFDYPGQAGGPRFQSRILVRTGQSGGKVAQKSWMGHMAGIKVFLEGFRVLPYGEASDDWLELYADYKRRNRTLRYLDEYDIAGDRSEVDEGLSILGSDSYFGGVFLTQESSGQLRVLVNREGFVPDASFDTIKTIIRIGTDLCVRVNAALTSERRTKRRAKRAQHSTTVLQSTLALKDQVKVTVERAQSLAQEARLAANAGNIKKAAKLVTEAASEFQLGADTSDRLLTEPSMTRMLAAVGTQMAAFVHEMNALLGMAQSIEDSLARIRSDLSIDKKARQKLARLASSMGDLRRVVERQAAYLADVASPDARRRRSKQRLKARADAAASLIRPAADRANVRIENKIPEDLRSPAMFPAELTLVFSNLLTNALKAAGKNGKIRLTAQDRSGRISVRIENTGRGISLAKAEKWFRPFESTTATVDPYLGQGMGMGLPITRNMLEEYGAEISFVKPRSNFSAAIEFRFA